jgi:hypothetical protein
MRTIFYRPQFCLSTDPVDGNGAPPPETPPANQPALPPAAVAVLEGEENEELIKTRADLERERAARKKVEEEHATLADENHRLKSAGLNPNPPAPDKPDKRTALEKFMETGETD